MESKKAAWHARDSQREFVFDGNMWIIGGWFTPELPDPRDVWKSADRKNWTRVIETAPWEHSDLPVSLVFWRMWIASRAAEPDYLPDSEVWSLNVPEQWFGDD